MPVRVELLDEAVVDLAGLVEGGHQKQFFRKLLYIEEHGSKAGEPLMRELAGWRKVIVGNRDWRIVFRVDNDERVATVCVIGNREDGECYEEAKRRADDAENAEASSLAESMLDLYGSRKDRKKALRKRGTSH